LLTSSTDHHLPFLLPQHFPLVAAPESSLGQAMKLNDLARLVINRITTLAFGETSVLQPGDYTPRPREETGLLQFRAHSVCDYPTLSVSRRHD
jgi:hypothetical protein